MKKYPFFKTILKILNEVWKAEKKLFIFFAIYIVFVLTLPLLGIYLPRMIIEQLEQPIINFPKVTSLIIILTAIIGVFGFFEKLVRNYTFIRVLGVRINLMTNIFDKYTRLDYHYTEDPNFLNEHSDGMNVINNGTFEDLVERIITFIARILLVIIYIYLLIKLSIFYIAAVIFSLSFSILSSLVMKNINFKQKKNFANANRRISYYEGIVQDFNYGKDIRLYNFQNSIINSYDFEIKSYLSIFRKLKNKEYLLALGDLVMVLISDAMLYYFLINKVINGLDIASFSFYLLLALSLSTYLKEMVKDLVYMITNGQYLNDYFWFMKNEFNENACGIKDINTETLEIEFQNVSFKYPKTDNYIIKDLNLQIKKGEKLAIVGINGAGKTTIVKLLLRLFKPTEGRILINGIDANLYDKELYQSLFAPVFQEINILAFSVRDNITLGLSNDEEKIWKYLDMVGLGEKIRRLPKGLDTNLLKNIDEFGVVLSGGENQKLAIARALYKESKTVVLDEPTANLDALAEAEIYENFNELIQSKTTIFISHRLASTKFCDKIALFNNSKLEEYGSHLELMDLKGQYYQMFVIQGKYYQKGEEYESI